MALLERVQRLLHLLHCDSWLTCGCGPDAGCSQCSGCSSLALEPLHHTQRRVMCGGMMFQPTTPMAVIHSFLTATLQPVLTLHKALDLAVLSSMGREAL